MMYINSTSLESREINERLRQTDGDCTITGCCGQRFLCAGMSNRRIVIDGLPGNALGAYLDGADITVHANAQDAVGDTMNDGTIVIHGSIGDAAGYAMRGGSIYVRDDAGYRAGIHMKAYEQKVPVMVIGGTAGSFLGEYQAGGTIIVLGLHADGKRIVGNFPCTGMHGGHMYLRGTCSDIVFPPQASVTVVPGAELVEIHEYLARYSQLFDCPLPDLLDSPFTVVTPDSRNPYRQMYVAN